jgi:nitrate reductase NapE component
VNLSDGQKPPKRLSDPLTSLQKVSAVAVVLPIVSVVLVAIYVFCVKAIILILGWL